MDGQRQLRFMPRTPGSWTQEHFGSPGRTPEERSGETTAVDDLIQPGEANAALKAAAPRMLHLLLHWIRGGDVNREELHQKTRELITELEPATANWVSVETRHRAGSLEDVAARPTSESGES